MLKTYKDLNVWKKAYALCLKIYGISKNFPVEERYGLTSQIKRSAVSIPFESLVPYLLGHSDLRTTMIYTHVVSKNR
ncbi:MAG: four helix bundle protein, partial [Desulfobacterales bacterium]|nr:four helix bundle protein [Desulfobacterales bacterium]